jgi:hypothetical protein
MPSTEALAARHEEETTMSPKNALTKATTETVRLHYPNVIEPKPIMGQGAPKFSVGLLIPKTDIITLARLEAAMKAAAMDGLRLWGGQIPSNLLTPLHDGDVDRPGYPEYAGCMYLNATSARRPYVVDANLAIIMDPAAVYAGCFGRASLFFFAYFYAGKAGIGVRLNGLQKTADGEPIEILSSTAEEDFGPASMSSEGV